MENKIDIAIEVGIWMKTDADLKKLKEQELALRKRICDDIFRGRIGSFTKKEEVGVFLLTAVSKTTLFLDEETFEYDELTDDEKDCLKSKMSLVSSGLKKLNDDSKLWDSIIEKPATPTLSIE